ncbi:tRNA (N6-threonylcarbamoyladenosine(37)-N6)-methyltransferase TrmO [Acinetobacter nectaris]|uniref:tRNA (N6-threonylcarbamoyladenosine(37)-N6)-methyltransferase TrmO n=1 Tax=Acinetobacter nectaris TaxID=1219382 RepID=UPI001F01D700|nr:tRNA (N6-threonylcarbamoyladenosine(37)-N6)-methyltransferase TrmO [Acinetobacter nectaris]MCF8999485.1 tRNA (N6-threonylcarbamoyladenosine(37)-N6)-methyltransferase TrmO [Acinetobacter nectaris]MCF9028013.1 tRNA (N6-threonylcarbamoyladenosine(37)-N6)-methyltransferase TrmO [Acinetobacter nectaris]
MKVFNPIQFPVIGVMHSPFREKFGIPRQPNLVDVESYIEFHSPYNDLSAFEGIEEFSHLWLLWNFHENKQASSSKFRSQVRPPRLGGNEKKGIFATRSMYRPAPIGMSVVKRVRVEKCKNTVRLYVTGSDLLHGTPILDIKPYIVYSDAVTEALSGYAMEEPNKKAVIWESVAKHQQEILLRENQLTPKIIHSIEQVLSLDPRPAYQNDEQRIYGMKFDIFDVRFKVICDYIHIVEIIT